MIETLDLEVIRKRTSWLNAQEDLDARVYDWLEWDDVYTLIDEVTRLRAEVAATREVITVGKRLASSVRGHYGRFVQEQIAKEFKETLAAYDRQHTQNHAVSGGTANKPENNEDQGIETPGPASALKSASDAEGG